MLKELSLLDRLTLGTVLPTKGNFEYLLVRGDILEKIKVTTAETVELGITQAGESITWNKEASAKRWPYEFTESECSTIKTKLKEMSDKQELSAELMPLYKAFV